MSDEVAVPRTRTGKRVSPASLQRHREYVDWLVTLPVPRRDDESRDDSYEAFAAQRRRQREAARLKRVWEQRREPSAAARAAAQQRERDYTDWLRAQQLEHGPGAWRTPDDEEPDHAASRAAFMRERRLERRRAGYAARMADHPLTGTRTAPGPPPDPNSKRQRLLAARAAHGRCAMHATCCAASARRCAHGRLRSVSERAG